MAGLFIAGADFPPGDMSRMFSLECPCCGDVGAFCDKDGYFTDGQTLICGCSGWVSVGENDVWINNGDEPCPDTALCHIG